LFGLKDLEGLPDLSEFREIERAVEQANTGPVEGIETHPEDTAEIAPESASEAAPSNATEEVSVEEQSAEEPSDDDKTSH
jgi:hypothetical protein